MPSNKLPISGFILFGLLGLLDLALTTTLLTQGHGKVYESNPFASAWMARFGWPGLVAFKFLAIVVAGSASAILCRRRPLVGRVVLAFACLAGMAVNAYSIFLMFALRLT
jgi:hypothetical protein